ncbi:protein kinase [Aureobasidium pullulans]|uniref:EKC/KEOPS complex subunit BUD32 n=1 Tax=Aureobasidium pullulans TaxID=5580 RepID=A0A4V4LF42_AURPU|nr:protein kinase [Aureobasidium pullulans]
MSKIPQLPHDQKFEEERYPTYKAHQYYPVQLGQTLASRYRVMADWVTGRSKIITASSDNSIRQDILVTLKVCILGEDGSNELAISHHIKSFDDGIHPGKHRSRVTLDDFHIRGPHGRHHCLVFPALGRTLAQVRNVFEDRKLDKLLLQRFLYPILQGLDFLHQTGVVHTDISPNNILVEADNDMLVNLEETERLNPSPRKVLDDRVIQLSYTTPTSYKDPVITDFGAAYLGVPGQRYRDDVMPGVYRAPEVLAGMEWDSKIDIWSIGVMIWDLFEDGNLFPAYRNGHLDDELHFAQMIALMGPPPREFLDRMSETQRVRYWDSSGQYTFLHVRIPILYTELTRKNKGTWIAETPIPSQTLESREIRLQGRDQELLLGLMRKILCWLPEDRPSAEDLYNDGFIYQFVEYVMELEESSQGKQG